jgi:hypothetical protein
LVSLCRCRLMHSACKISVLFGLDGVVVSKTSIPASLARLSQTPPFGETISVSSSPEKFYPLVDLLEELSLQRLLPPLVLGKILVDVQFGLLLLLTNRVVWV